MNHEPQGMAFDVDMSKVPHYMQSTEASRHHYDGSSNTLGENWETNLRSPPIGGSPNSSSKKRSKRRRGRPSPESEKAVRNKLKAASYVGTRGRDLLVLFERLDTEHRGSLDRTQFEHGIRSHVSLTPTELEDVWNAMDKDHNGRIDADEFVRFIGGTRAYSLSNQA